MLSINDLTTFNEDDMDISPLLENMYICHTEESKCKLEKIIGLEIEIENLKIEIENLKIENDILFSKILALEDSLLKRNSEIEPSRNETQYHQYEIVDGYKFTKTKENKASANYKCSNRTRYNCPARLTVKKSGEGFTIATKQVNGEHNHLPPSDKPVVVYTSENEKQVDIKLAQRDFIEKMALENVDSLPEDIYNAQSEHFTKMYPDYTIIKYDKEQVKASVRWFRRRLPRSP